MAGLQILTTPPTAPQRSNDSDTFNDRADAFVSWFSTHVSEQNTLTAQLMASAALIYAAPEYADAALYAIAGSGLTPAADKGIYYTSGSAAALFDLSSVGRTLLAQTSQANMRAIGLGLGSLSTASTINGGNWSGTDLAVADGGTGASTASGARNNLGAAGSGANSDINSLSGLTTALSVAQGGTGAITAAAAIAALGGLKIDSASFASNTITLTTTLPNGDVLLVQGGYGSLGANTGGTITFGTAYSTAPVCIVGGGPNTASEEGDVHKTALATTTSQAIFNTSPSSNHYSWFAIGKG